jgi:GH43 family beta-xylosidase
LLKSAVLLLATTVLANAQTVSDFYNVVIPSGADPSVVFNTSTGWYYRTKSMGTSVQLWRSKTLSGMGSVGSKTIWTAPAGTPYSSTVWAPEIFFYSGTGKWYVYFAADNGTNSNHRMYVLESAGADPFTGTWTFKGQLTDSSNLWAIDGTVFEVNGQLYTIWSGWPTTTNSQQNLYIASMSNPWTINSSRVQISTPTYSWETSTQAIQEGPEVLIRNNKISVIYSASASWTDSYCLGQLTATVGSNLLSAASWTKKSTPVFSSANGIYGPGHCTFTKSPDGIEDWIVYHNAQYQGAGWTRQIRAQKFTWNSDNTPNFGTPFSRETRIAMPSGEIERWRYNAENASLSGGAVAASASSAAGGKYVLIDNTSKAVQFTVNVPVAAEYVLAVRAASLTPDESAASFNISVNGGSAASLSLPSAGWKNWTVVQSRVNLAVGANTIRFTKNAATAELDMIELFPFDPQANISGRTFRLVSRISGKVLDAWEHGTTNGSPVSQAIWGGGANQKWIVQSMGNSEYRLTGVESGLAVDVPGSSTADSVALQLYTPNTSDAQRWTFTPTTDGYFKLLNVNSGKAMDVRASSTASGAVIQQYRDNGSSAQEWQLLAP